MPDTKITALTAISTVDPAIDVLPIVDVSDTTMAASGTTKKITSNQILGAGGTATLASATITGDLTVDTNVLKVDSANNRVGIGTATPDNELSVRAASIATIDVRGGVGGAGGLKISGNGTTLGTTSFDLIQNSLGAIVYQRDALPLFFNVNGSERYAISSAGVATWSNVGGVAGTAMTLNSTGLGVGVTPSVRLHALTASLIACRLESTSASNASLIDFKDASTTATSKVMVGSNGDALRLYSGGNISATLDASGNLLVGTTSLAGSSSNATAVILGSARTANGSVSTTTAVASTIFSITAGLRGRYEVVALIANSGAPASYTSVASVIWDGNGGRVVANNGTNLTITLSGSDVQVTQTSGSAQTVFWSFLRVALA